MASFHADRLPSSLTSPTHFRLPTRHLNSNVVSLLLLTYTVEYAKRKEHPSSDSQDRIAKRRRAYHEEFPSAAPFNQGRPSNFFKLQDSVTGGRIACNRPSTASSTPVTLSHPAFGQFVDDCQNYCPTDVDNKLVLKLSTEMSGFFELEKNRAEKFRSILKEYYEINLEEGSIPNTPYSTHGHLIANGFCYLITEAKKELGSTTSDPYLQAGLYYHHFTKGYTRVATMSVLPCFHIFYFGACVGFAGSVMSEDKIHMDVLCPILPLFWQCHDVGMRTMAARFFGALRKVIERLKEYYEVELPAIQNSASLDQAKPGFPYKCDYVSQENGSRVWFSYDDDQPRKNNLIFFGRTRILNQTICIKFTRSYSKEAHLFCASVGRAPALHGYEALSGGWYMVVMDEIDTDIYTRYSDNRGDFPPANQLRPGVEEVIRGLHNQDLVHGDLRPENLMVKMGDEVDFLLIDFDWGGNFGTVRYPLNVNNETISRPAGARDGELVTKEHDLEMLRIMFAKR